MSDHRFVQKPWGSEVWFANNDLYCGKELYVRKNRTSSNGKFHYHKVKDETFYIIIGVLSLEFYDPGCIRDRDGIMLAKGDSFRIAPHTRHRFTAMHRDCRFIETSTHHEDSDSYYEG